MSSVNVGNVDWSTNKNELREVNLVLHLFFAHDKLSFVDHVDFNLQCLGLSLSHAVAEAVAYNSNQEIH